MIHCGRRMISLKLKTVQLTRMTSVEVMRPLLPLSLYLLMNIQSGSLETNSVTAVGSASSLMMRNPKSLF